MSNFIDMTGWVMAEHGVKDSRLKVIKRVDNYVADCGSQSAQWLCECSCEKHTQFILTTQRVKTTKSCGCLRTEKSAERLKQMNAKPTTVELRDGYAVGFTPKNEEFWFDIEFIDFVKAHCWHYDKCGYVRSRINGKGVRLHRYVMGVTDSAIIVDHIVHPPWGEHQVDNRKSNLRLVTNSQNQMNSKISKNNTTGVKGVSKSGNQYVARIMIKGKSISLGYYSTLEEAAKARQDAEKQFFGNYAYDTFNNETT